LEKEKEHSPGSLHPAPAQKGTGISTDARQEIKNDDTGTFKRYLRLADQLLGADKKDDDPSSSAA
jgi:hypothetical protein